MPAVCEGKEGLFGTRIISRDPDWPAACNCAWPLFPKISGLLNCGSMPRACYTGLRIVLCLSMGEKNGPCTDVLSCLFAAPFGVGEGPVLIDTRVTPLSFCTFCLSRVLSFVLFSWDFSGQSLFSQSSPGHTEH